VEQLTIKKFRIRIKMEWLVIDGKRYLKFRCLKCGRETMIDESSLDIMSDLLGIEIEDMLYCQDCILEKRRKISFTL